MSIPKRKLSELVTGYHLDGRIRDVIVEGYTDKHILADIFAGALPFGTFVRCENEIEIDLDNASGLGGSRGRVILACEHVASLNLDNITGVVDRDLDPFQRYDVIANLHKTHYSSLEFHIASADRIRTVVNLSLLENVSKSQFQKVLNVAAVLFNFRLFAAEKGLKGAFPDLKKDIDFEEDDLERIFDLSSFAVRLDSKNSTGSAWTEALRIDRNRLQTIPGSDFESVVNFHDLERVFGIFLSAVRGIKETQLPFDWLGKLVRAQIGPNIQFDDFFGDLFRRVRLGVAP